jgi:Fe-S-cluster-containing hydrogenase component 2
MARHQVAFRAELCTACRSCEIACSFARLGEYRPSAAGLAVQLDRLTGAVDLSFTGDCADCLDEPNPPCVAFCPPGALILEGCAYPPGSDGAPRGG